LLLVLLLLLLMAPLLADCCQALHQT